MKFIESDLAGAFVIEPERLEDERGFFARVWCKDEFLRQGLNPCIAQCNISFNKKCGTLRGMHYQRAPHQEDKLVRCTMGEIYDVIIDLRPDSPTCNQYFATRLSAENRRMLYIPKGFAHGFQTLVDNTEVHYQMSEVFVPGVGSGVRWDSPVFSIEWPDFAERTISEQDRQWSEDVG